LFLPENCDFEGIPQNEKSKTVRFKKIRKTKKGHQRTPLTEKEGVQHGRY